MVAYAPRAAKGASKGNNLAALLKGRKLVSNQRYVGSVKEWHSGWGWVEPLDEVAHPQIKRNKGLIYINQSDVRPKTKVAVGTVLDFSLYSDARGLGAIDCCEVEAGVTEAAEAAAKGDEEPLPEGWEKQWSAEHSEWYYWNKFTKDTAWVRPTEAQADAAEEEEEKENPLPAGWEKVFDSENNDWYYWHKATKKSTWERPTVAQTAKAPGAPKQKADDAAEKAVLGQQRIKGKVVEWQGFFGWIKPSETLSADLKPLAERNQGKIYVNWRDVQPGLTLKAGVEVAFLLYADDNGLAASDVREPEEDDGEGSSHGVQELTQQYFSEDNESTKAAGGDKSTQEEEVLEGPLLPGWEQYWSDEHNCFYYWHKATKQSAWERPCMPVFEDEEKEPEKVWEGEGTQEGASRKATPLTPMVSAPGSHLTPATPGAGRTPTAPSQTKKSGIAPASSVYLRGKKNAAADEENEEPAPPQRNGRPIGGAGGSIPAFGGNNPYKRPRQW